MAYTIDTEEPYNNNIIPAAELKIGEIGIILGGCCDGQYLLSTYSCWVLLNNPQVTWHNPPFNVRLIPPGTKIILTVRE